MRSLAFLLATLIAMAVSLWAQVLPNADRINKSVVFIYPPAPDGSPNESLPLGTGFFVQVPQKSRPDRAWWLLATARHVVQPAWAFCPPHVNPAAAYIRLNKKHFVEGQDIRGVDFLRIDLSQFMTGPDDIDVAVTGLSIPDVNVKYDVDAVPMYYFARTEDIQALSFGDDVATAGLLPTFPGSARNYPFFKFGHISAKPSEAIQVPCAPNELPRSMRLLWVAMNVLPGNSGSPVFYTPSLGSGRKPAFIGVLSVSVVAADVAGMVSAEEVYKIIEKMNLADADLKRGEIPQQPAIAPPKPTIQNEEDPNGE